METIRRHNPLKIVFIEDETHLLEALRDLFDDSYQVNAFTNVEDALGWINAGNQFDVIVSDLNLPNMTGRDLYEELKSRHRDEEKKIIFMTGGIFTAELTDWYTKLSNVKFQKPFNINKMRDLLDKMS